MVGYVFMCLQQKLFISIPFQQILWCLRGMQSIFCTVSRQYSAMPDSFFGLMLNKKTCLGCSFYFCYLSTCFSISTFIYAITYLLGGNFPEMRNMGLQYKPLIEKSNRCVCIYIVMAETNTKLRDLSRIYFVLFFPSSIVVLVTYKKCILFTFLPTFLLFLPFPFLPGDLGICGLIQAREQYACERNTVHSCTILG